LTNLTVYVIFASSKTGDKMKTSHVTIKSETAQQLRELGGLDEFFRYRNPDIVEQLVDERHKKAVRQGKIIPKADNE